ncbi:hypothetical protein G6O69_00765 [Pseudenhygromyxa sp. WMMC2535]|uniref:hypothetical protein n=1 Tax=Pseudenhygromyxa sp. WMMC2535 TaxID=2712867 RepID=UPI001553A419|nr:hypothetical protein [Pseudenhygromyxa sp. WMMC2535]NVB36341.1 hypothetical protein [Pseudenhygromyxa sp. WMMC2535]
MLTCHACHRYVREDEHHCPFCAARLRTVQAPSVLPSLALVAGLSLLGCSDDGSEEASTDDNAGMDTEESGESTTAGSEGESEAGETEAGETGSGESGSGESGSGESGETTTDTSGETTTTTTTGEEESAEEWAEEGGADYAGPPECSDIFEGTWSLGDNPVDTTQGSSWVWSSCGEASGDGKDVLRLFTAEEAGVYSFALVDADFEGWLVRGLGFECEAMDDPECTLPQASLVLDLSAGQEAYVWVDGTDSGTGTVVVSQE